MGKEGRVVSLGETIRRHRKDLGWTQAELAERVGVDNTLVSHWEADRRTPSNDRLLELEEVFGLGQGDLGSITEAQFRRLVEAIRAEQESADEDRLVAAMERILREEGRVK